MSRLRGKQHLRSLASFRGGTLARLEHPLEGFGADLIRLGCDIGALPGFLLLEATGIVVEYEMPAQPFSIGVELYLCKEMRIPRSYDSRRQQCVRKPHEHGGDDEGGGKERTCAW